MSIRLGIWLVSGQISEGRKMKRAMRIQLAALVLTGLAVTSQSQIVITSEDMFLEEGLYSRVYKNDGGPVGAAQFIGSAGGPNFWDFTGAPRDGVIRYDYLEPSASIEADSFPGAAIVERSTDEATSETLSEIFFEPVQGVGRKVYGFVREGADVTEQLLGIYGALPFSSPIVDFPANMKFGDTWSTVSIFTTNQDATGGIIGSVAQFRIINTEDFTIDAYGFAELPGLGIIDVLRLNSVVKSDIQIKQDESFVSISAPSYSRIYRWIGRNKGIVVEMASEVSADLSGNASPPPVIFERAQHIFTMFETNKQATGSGCNEADPVLDLNITYDKANNRVFLRWTKVDCASFYRVEASDGLGAGHTWELVEQTTKDFSFDLVPRANQMKLYRIVSVLE